MFLGGTQGRAWAWAGVMENSVLVLTRLKQGEKVKDCSPNLMNLSPEAIS